MITKSASEYQLLLRIKAKYIIIDDRSVDCNGAFTGPLAVISVEADRDALTRDVRPGART